MKKAKFIKTILIDDPDENVVTTVSLSVYQHENGNFFAVDDYFLLQFDSVDNPIIPDPFENILHGVPDETVMLMHG